MDTIRRWTIAIAAFLMVFGSSMVVAGTAPTDAPRDSPVFFETAGSHPGDRGLYRLALVVVNDGAGQYHDMEAQYSFERLPDQLMLDSVGNLQPTQSFIGEWKTEPYQLDLDTILAMPQLSVPPTPQLSFPNCWPAPPSNWQDEKQVDDYEDAMDDCSDQWDDAGDEYEDAWDDWEDDFEDRQEAYSSSIGAWESALSRDTHLVRASDWHVTHHDGNATIATTYREDAEVISDVQVRNNGPLGLGGQSSTPAIEQQRLTFTTPLDAPGPCGWKTTLQEGPQDMWDPILVHGECPADMFLGFADVDHIAGPITMEVSGTDHVDGLEAVVFSTPADEDRLRLWFVEENPYPVRILTRTTSVPEPIQEALGNGYSAPRFYLLHEMVGFERGVEAPPLAGLATAPTTTAGNQWGPDTTDFDHPWPLGVAAEATSASLTDCDDWRDWISANPNAGLYTAGFTIVESEDPDHAEPIVDEAWTVVMNGPDDGFEVVMQRHTQTQADDPGLPNSPGPIRLPQISCANMQVTAQTQSGSGQMPTVAATATLQSLWTGAEATTYGYRFNQTHYLTVGVTPVSPGDAIDTDLLTLDAKGGLAQHVAVDAGYPTPIFDESGWTPRADGAWQRVIATSGAWKMPAPATAATLLGLSAATGALILLAPALKAFAGSFGLFSRIKKEDLLDHPVRGEVMDVITADPGIHFQAIVRRMGKGRGTMEHHIRKMVGAELLVEKSERGFTCYFPKGQLNRHLMAAAPVLKAVGARAVMQAVVGQPGTVTTEVAEHLGMAGSTVNYHVKKLIEAGLIEGQRNGRFVTLRSTTLGDQAFSQFGRT